MIKGIPWDTLGPAALVAVVILAIVFGFILKWQKATKPATAPSNPPKDINETDKKSLCFEHHGDIASNRTSIKMITKQQAQAQKENREDHGTITQKIEDLGTTIIKEIQKANGD